MIIDYEVVWTENNKMNFRQFSYETKYRRMIHCHLLGLNTCNGNGLHNKRKDRWQDTYRYTAEYDARNQPGEKQCRHRLYKANHRLTEGVQIHDHTQEQGADRKHRELKNKAFEY